MKKFIRLRAMAIAACGAAMAFTSCTYPYYGSAGGSYSGGGYDSGYGDGYGYGSSNFSTSLFVSTGNPRWAYDPHCHAYYDYSRRCYYDPYLYGYYPVGYRPPVMVGCPHPHGYRRSYCPPPAYVKNVTVVNYRNREQAYRGSNYDWARQVRQKPVHSGGGHSRSNSDWQRQPERRTYDSRPSTSPGQYRSPSGNRGTSRQEVRPQASGSRLPSGYNTPVNRDFGKKDVRRAETTRPSFNRQPSGYQQSQRSSGQRVQQAPPPSRQSAPARQPQPSRQSQPSGRSEEDRGKGSSRSIRGLGQG
jgi:hypothetical protein